MRFLINIIRSAAIYFATVFFAGAIFAAPAGPPASSATEKTKTCFQCNGTGTGKCPVAACKNGKAPCPAPCLKPTVGVWEHMNVAGHSPNDVWQKFRMPGGGYQAWNQNHYGEVIAMQNGKPVNVGKCKVCGGSMVVKCQVCNGTGIAPCTLCGGMRAT